MELEKLSDEELEEVIESNIYHEAPRGVNREIVKKMLFDLKDDFKILENRFPKAAEILKKKVDGILEVVGD